MPRKSPYTRTVPNPPTEPIRSVDWSVWRAALEKACKGLPISPDQLDAMVDPEEKGAAQHNVPQLVAFAKSYLRHSAPPPPRSVNSWNKQNAE